MKLIVTVGNANGDSEELVFDIPEPITWLGAEIEDTREGDDRSRTGRRTIVRIPFSQHGPTILHTLCTANGDVEEVKL